MPPPLAAAKAIAGCVRLTAKADDDVDVAARYADQLRCGIELGDQVDLWSPPSPPEDEHRG